MTIEALTLAVFLALLLIDMIFGGEGGIAALGMILLVIGGLAFFALQ